MALCTLKLHVLIDANVNASCVSLMWWYIHGYGIIQNNLISLQNTSAFLLPIVTSLPPDSGWNRLALLLNPGVFVFSVFPCLIIFLCMFRKLSWLLEVLICLTHTFIILAGFLPWSCVLTTDNRANSGSGNIIASQLCQIIFFYITHSLDVCQQHPSCSLYKSGQRNMSYLLDSLVNIYWASPF